MTANMQVCIPELKLKKESVKNVETSGELVKKMESEVQQIKEKFLTKLNILISELDQEVEKLKKEKGKETLH